MLCTRLTALGFLATTTLIHGCFSEPANSCDSEDCRGSSSGDAGESGTTPGAPTTGETDDAESTDDSEGTDDSGVGDTTGSLGSEGGQDASTGGLEASSSGEETDSGRPTAECGNGVLERGEACDDGEGNSDTLADACRTSCALPTCGDAVIDSEEDCDEEATGCLVDCSFDAPVFGEFPEATLVIGQPDFTSGEANAFEYAFRFPRDVLTHQGRLYVTDGIQAGIYVFDEVPNQAGVEPDHVLGRDGIGGSELPLGPNSVGAFSRGMASDGTRFGIADVGAPRVLLYNEAPVETSDPDVVIGQPDLQSSGNAVGPNRFSGGPSDLLFAGGRMVVSDSGGNRVLIWNTIPTENDTPADLVLGQATFEEAEPNRGGEPSASTLSAPTAVWSDGGRLAIADRNNQRVLLWNSFPTEPGEPADVVLGQPDASSSATGSGATGFHNPQDVLFVGGRLYVSDQLNHRVLFYEGWPAVDGQAADGVIGQSSFENSRANDDDQDGSTDETPSARTLARPFGLHFDQGRLFVTDTFNHRTLVFEGS